MNISSDVGVSTQRQNAVAIKTNFTKKISADEAEDIRAQIKQNANAIALNSTNIQIGASKDNFALLYADFQSFLNDVGYEGKPIAELSQGEAAELISEDGIFGIEQTSERIANFVINGAGGDEDRMRAGREGMIQGFKDAENLWGEELPEISQQTMKKAIEMVDNAMIEAGFSIIDTQA